MRLHHVLAIALAALGGCDGSPQRSGLDALVRVAGAQYFAGAMPAAVAPGPAVTAVESLNNTVRPGQQGKRLTGRIGKGGTALALGFEGDTGYWIVPAGVEDPLVPGELAYDVRLSFSPLLPAGPRDLLLRAVDESGRLGPAEKLGLTTQSGPPDGKLVIALAWDTDADLDLHLVLPDGTTEIWARNLSSYVPPAPGELPDPLLLAAAGYLDFDSNAQCVIDGHRAENILWKKPDGMPPTGHYIARVDTFSLCGQAGARWTLEARAGDQLLGQSTGVVGDSDTRMGHLAGAGVTALELDYEGP